MLQVSELLQTRVVLTSPLSRAMATAVVVPHSLESQDAIATNRLDAHNVIC